MKFFEHIFTRKPATKTESEIATLIERFVDDTGERWDWDYFISTHFENEKINWAQNECFKVQQEFPRTGRVGWCGKEGLDRLRAIASELRAFGLRRYDGENAALVRAMNEVADKHDPEDYREMLRLFLDSMVYIPIALSLNPKREYSSLALPIVMGREGQKLTPIFTDVEVLKIVEPAASHTHIQCRGFFEILSRYTDIQGVIVNPVDPLRPMIRPCGIIMLEEVGL